MLSAFCFFYDSFDKRLPEIEIVYSSVTDDVMLTICSSYVITCAGSSYFILSVYMVYYNTLSDTVKLFTFLPL